MLDINIEKMNQILSDEDLAKLIFDYAMSPSDIDFARAIEQAVMQKPLEQKPVAWVHSSGFVTKDADWVFDRKEECEPLYLHPAPSAPEVSLKDKLRADITPEDFGVPKEYAERAINYHNYMLAATRSITGAFINPP